MQREDLGSWLEGAPADEGYVRGSSIGLPPSGPGSPAPFGRRVLGLLIDWGVCAGISWFAFDYDPLITLALFAVINVLLTSLFGLTLGQLLLRIHVVPVRGRSPMVLRAIVRTVLMLLVLPAVIWNRDGQPLHDVVAGTAVVRV